MNSQMFRYSKLFTKLNKSLADEVDQPTGFPGKFFFTNHSSNARSNKKHKRKKLARLGFLK